MLTATDLAILAELVNDSAVVMAQHLGIDTCYTQQFLERFTEFVRELNERAGNLYFAFEMSSSPLTGSVISVEDVVESSASSRECMVVDTELHFQLHPDLRRADTVEICRHSKTVDSVMLRVEGSAFTVIVAGVPCGYVNVFAPVAKEPRLSRRSRSGREYDLLINDHHSQVLPFEMDLYWKDRPRRVLAGGQTEKILHQSLWRWLKLNVNDGRVRGEIRNLSPERTDIEVVGFIGDPYVYLIEVKWLGVNQSGTPHNQERIGEGARQVKVYLNGDETATLGLLVCYDGRSQKEHQSHSEIDAADKHPKGRYYVLYLPSEAASSHGGS